MRGWREKVLAAGPRHLVLAALRCCPALSTPHRGCVPGESWVRGRAERREPVLRDLGKLVTCWCSGCGCPLQSPASPPKLRELKRSIWSCHVLGSRPGFASAHVPASPEQFDVTGFGTHVLHCAGILLHLPCAWVLSFPW